MERFEDMVHDALAYFVKQGKTTVRIGEIKVYLLKHYNMKSLLYPSMARNILRSFVELAKFNDWVTEYDMKTGIIMINEEWADLVKLKQEQQGESE